MVWQVLGLYGILLLDPEQRLAENMVSGKPLNVSRRYSMDFPAKVTERITLTYWKCGRHCKVHHQSKEAALRCTAKVWAGSDAQISAKDRARSEKAWTLKQHGLNYEEIGVHLGLSASRARQIVEDGRSIEATRRPLLSDDTNP